MTLITSDCAVLQRRVRHERQTLRAAVKATMETRNTIAAVSAFRQGLGSMQVSRDLQLQPVGSPCCSCELTRPARLQHAAGDEVANGRSESTGRWWDLVGQPGRGGAVAAAEPEAWRPAAAAAVTDTSVGMGVSAWTILQQDGPHHLGLC